ncbi:response regulator [bacterium]|nr:response regulator [bacterium]
MRHIGIMNMNTEKEFRILLIDDHELTINTLTAYFINTKYAVDTVTDRYSALTKIKNNTYDLIFVDFTLPGIKEPLIVNSLQKISSETRIIIITKNYSDDIHYLCLKYKIYPDAFIYKPIDIDKIKKIISRIENIQNSHKIEIV